MASSQGSSEGIISTTGTLDSNKKVRLTVVKQQLDVKLRLLSDMDKEILNHCEIDAIPRELANIITCKQKIDEVTSASASVTGVPPPMAHTTLPPPVTVAKSRLPRLQADVKNWPAFWDSLKSAVHDNAEIPQVDKFNYLNSLLESTALKSVQGLTLTEGNYDKAVEMLRERFGDPQQIISSHMKGLLKILNCSGNCSCSSNWCTTDSDQHQRPGGTRGHV